LRVALILERATVTGALIGAYLAGVVPQEVLEFLFALMMLQSVYFSLSKQAMIWCQPRPLEPMAR